MDLTFPLLVARFVLAALFLVAGVAKLLDRAGSRDAIAGFGFPKSLAAPLGVALPLIEIVVAIALIPAATASGGALGALVLLGLFIAGIANVMINRREAECHCFGQLHSSRVGWPTLLRNIALGLLAGFVVASQRGSVSPSYVESIGDLSRAELLALVVGTIVVSVFLAGAWFMARLLRQHGRLLLRLDTLEEQLAARGIISPARAGSADGLPLGTRAPAFKLPNLRGGSTTLEDLLAPGLPVVLLFGHPGCTPCVAMLPEIGRWQSQYGSDLTLALITEGEIEFNRSIVAEHGIDCVLVQKDREIAEAYEAWATPSAVLVSTDGLIASPAAQGAAAMRLVLSAAMASVSAGMSRNTSHNGNGNGGVPRPPGREDAAGSMSRVGLDAG